MVRIRLRRVGARNQPSYRIVAADKESPRDGRFLEILGNYNPRTEPSTVVVDEARLFHWLQHGAQPSDAVRQALNALGTWERWERFKQGEPLEKLLEEAEKALPEIDPRTRRDDLVGKRKKKAKARKKDEAKEAVEETPEVEEAPAEEEEKPDAAEETEAEAEPEETPTEEKEAPEVVDE
ncbi:MAG: 30S ribosomal protein S16, partial [Anaerolineales bacterium]